ncbi:ferritin-like domain-containing protein [Gelidibacter salicanalis]|uniref:Ferritin-like domain-containing protein n=1 Tax=Gelidibacter salicanalis TaxID=291193 RepID=A0A5C7AIW6_9FLAO|nr:ferritin-like domain-containing protein [Gelidibacter salicanalis]TXE08660.1 ferritin-like domain-containing protein [Gelidibacter salicanalis]
MKKELLKEQDGQRDFNKRRQFLKLSGVVVIGSGLMMACSNDDDGTDLDPEVFDLGSGNLGILNYAYALEQLEAAFYTKVLDGAYWAGAPANEKRILEDVYNHEVIHREFFKTAITAVAPNDIVPQLEFNFSSVDFSSRASVLGTSKVLEDTGVKAYNGAGKLINVGDAAGMAYLTLAGKIVSVEARHASVIRDLLNPKSQDFAGDDILIGLSGTGKAFDKAAEPSEVLAEVGATGFVVTPFTAKNLPTS